MSTYVINCALLALDESGALSNIANSYLQEFLHLDDRKWLKCSTTLLIILQVLMSDLISLLDPKLN